MILHVLYHVYVKVHDVLPDEGIVKNMFIFVSLLKTLIYLAFKNFQKYTSQGNRNWKIYASTGQWTLYTNVLMIPTKVIK